MQLQSWVAGKVCRWAWRGFWSLLGYESVWRRKPVSVSLCCVFSLNQGVFIGVFGTLPRAVASLSTSLSLHALLSLPTPFYLVKPSVVSNSSFPAHTLIYTREILYNHNIIHDLCINCIIPMYLYSYSSLIMHILWYYIQDARHVRFSLNIGTLLKFTGWHLTGLLNRTKLGPNWNFIVTRPKLNKLIFPNEKWIEVLFTWSIMKFFH